MEKTSKKFNWMKILQAVVQAIVAALSKRPKLTYPLLSRRYV